MITSFLIASDSVFLFGKEKHIDDILPVICKQQLTIVSCSIPLESTMLKLIEKSKVFSVNTKLMPELQRDCCEQHEALVENKFLVCAIEQELCQTIECACLRNAEVLECELISVKKGKETAEITGKILLKRNT